jgi:hypothetical protein
LMHPSRSAIDSPAIKPLYSAVFEPNTPAESPTIKIPSLEDSPQESTMGENDL